MWLKSMQTCPYSAGEQLCAMVQVKRGEIRSLSFMLVDWKEGVVARSIEEY